MLENHHFTGRSIHKRLVSEVVEDDDAFSGGVLESTPKRRHIESENDHDSKREPDSGLNKTVDDSTVEVNEACPDAKDSDNQDGMYPLTQRFSVLSDDSNDSLDDVAEHMKV